MLTPEQSREYEALCVGAVVELVDTPVLDAVGAIRESSSLSRPTNSGSGEVATTGDLKSPA